MRKPWLLVALVLLTVSSAFAATDTELAAAGKAASARREFGKAAEFYEKAIKLKPRSAEYHYLLGLAYGNEAARASMLRAAGLAKKTQAAFEKAVELDPNYLDARHGLIDYYMLAPGVMGGSADKALAQAAALKKIDLLHGARAYSRIYTRQKKLDLARMELLDAVRAMPNSGKAHYYLGAFLLGEKNFAGGRQEIETALKLEPTHIPIFYRLGQYSALAEKDYARGEESLRKYLAYKPKENEPQHFSAWYFLGMIQEKQGRKAEARNSYLQAQKGAPEAKYIKEALKRVS